MREVDCVRGLSAHVKSGANPVLALAQTSRIKKGFRSRSKASEGDAPVCDRVLLRAPGIITILDTSFSGIGIDMDMDRQ